MIDCPNGAPIEITVESELGNYVTTKERVTFCIRRVDGTYFIRALDGTEWVTNLKTVVKELPYKCGGK